MIITCSQCQAKFKVAPEQIKETGSKVRCSNCQYVFTVFRPRRRDEAGATDLLSPAAASSDALDSYLAGSGGGGQADDFGLNEIFGDRPAPRPDGRDMAESYEDPDDGLDEFTDTDDDGPHLRASEGRSATMRERRDHRRRLYSGLEEENGPEDDLESGGFDEDGLVDEDGRPPLRRTARSRPGEPAPDSGEDFDEPGDEPYDDEAQYGEPPYDDQAEDEDGDYYEERAEGEYSYESTRLARQVNDLGLSADPVDPDKFIDDAAVEGRYFGSSSESPSIRAAVTKTSSRPPLKLIIGLAALALILGLGIAFIANRPAPKALSGGDEAAETTPVGESGGAAGDQTGTEGITFTRGNQNHYFRENNEAGNILIITGMVRNSYPDRRSFIRLRGHLLAADGRTLADRFVYAGNIISEEELKTLSMREIFSRLSIKGGLDGRNMNIEPGQEIPFMLVFDKLPDGMAEYRIDPVGSSPSD